MIFDRNIQKTTKSQRRKKLRKVPTKMVCQKLEVVNAHKSAREP
jgi:hypothetical protein